MNVANMLRRLVCLPPLGSDLASAQAPHTLRQALYPMVLIYTASYLGLELREFVFSAEPRFLTPEMYTGLLAAFAGEHEVRAHSGHAPPSFRAMSRQRSGRNPASCGA